MIKSKRRHIIALGCGSIFSIVICALCLSVPVTSFHMTRSKRPSLFPSNMRDVIANNRSPFGITYNKDIAANSVAYLKRNLKREQSFLTPNSKTFRDRQTSLDVYKSRDNGGAFGNKRGSRSFVGKLEPFKNNDIYTNKRGVTLKKAIKDINYLADGNFVNESPKSRNYNAENRLNKMKFGSSNSMRKQESSPAAKTLNLNKYLKKVFGSTPYDKPDPNSISYKTTGRSLEDKYISKSLKPDGRSFKNHGSETHHYIHRYEQRTPNTAFSFSNKEANKDLKTTGNFDGVKTSEIPGDNSLRSWNTIETVGLPVTPPNNNIWKPIGDNLKDPIEAYKTNSADNYKAIEVHLPENHLYDLPDSTQNSFDNKNGKEHHNLFDRVGITDVPISSKIFDRNIEQSIRQHPKSSGGLKQSQFSASQGQFDISRFNGGTNDYVKGISVDPTDATYPDGYPITTAKYDHNVVHHPMDKRDQHKLPVHEHTSNTLFEVQKNSAITYSGKYQEKPHMKLHRQDAKFRYVPGQQKGTPSNNPSISVKYVSGSDTFKSEKKQFGNDNNSVVGNTIRKGDTSGRNEGLKPPSFSVKGMKWKVEQEQQSSVITPSVNTEQKTDDITAISIPIQKYLSTMTKPTGGTTKTGEASNEEDQAGVEPFKKPPVVFPVSGKDTMKSFSATSGKRRPLPVESSNNGSNDIVEPKPKSAEDKYVVLSGKEDRLNSLFRKTLVLDDNHHITKSLAPYIEIKMTPPPIMQASTSTVQTTQTTSATKGGKSSMTTKSSSLTTLPSPPSMVTSIPETTSETTQNRSTVSTETKTTNTSDKEKTPPLIIVDDSGNMESKVSKQMSTVVSTDTSVSTKVPPTTVSPTSLKTTEKNNEQEQTLAKETQAVNNLGSINATQDKNLKERLVSNDSKSVTESSRTDVPSNLEETVTENIEAKTVNETSRVLSSFNESLSKATVGPKITENMKNYPNENETTTGVHANGTSDSARTMDMTKEEHGSTDQKNKDSTSKTTPETTTIQHTSTEMTTNNPTLTSTSNVGIRYKDENLALGKGQNASVYVEDVPAKTWSDVDGGETAKEDTTLESYPIPSVEWLSKTAAKNSRPHHQHFIAPDGSLPDVLKDYSDDIWKDKPTLPLPSVDSVDKTIDKKACNDSFNKEEMMTIAFGILQLLLQNMKLQQSLHSKHQVSPQAPKRRFLLIPLPANHGDPLSSYMSARANSPSSQHPPTHFVDYYSDIGQVDKNILYPKSPNYNDRRYTVQNNSLYPNVKHPKDRDPAGLRRSKALLSLLQNKSKSFRIRNHAKRIAPRPPLANSNHKKRRTI